MQLYSGRLRKASWKRYLSVKDMKRWNEHSDILRESIPIRGNSKYEAPRKYAWCVFWGRSLQLDWSTEGEVGGEVGL